MASRERREDESPAHEPGHFSHFARRSRHLRRAGAQLAAVAGLSCGAAPEPALERPLPPRAAPPPGAPPVLGALAPAPPSPAPSAPDATPAAPDGPCPADMAFVDTTYCPKVRLSCRNDEYDKPNHITICHEFAPGQACLGKPRRQRFCIDRYEYPNREGAHPPVMVDWYDAAGACAAEGKRLCWESEWVSACEGPEKLPFPYGYKRDSTKCNIDNAWIDPSLEKLYSKRPEVAERELLRLDRSVPSGAKAGCVSGFGVHDLTGNLDEWVNADAHHDTSLWAGLKGGAWGHVRNACRPMTTSHPPEFTYYFISFRCCKDAAPDASAAADPSLWTPPPQPDHPDPSGAASRGWTPPPSDAKQVAP